MAGNERRGFAGMDEGKQRQIASKGGRAAHEKGTAHEFTSEEAREAGRKGGEAVSRDRQHMAAIGREGGLSARGGRQRRPAGSGNAERAENAEEAEEEGTRTRSAREARSEGSPEEHSS